MQSIKKINPDIETFPAEIGKFYAPDKPEQVEDSRIKIESHPFCEAFITLNPCRFFLNGEILTLHPGDCCHIGMWIPHQYMVSLIDGQECLQLWIQLLGNELNYLLFCFRPGGVLLLRERGTLPGEYSAIFRRLESEFIRSGKPEKLRAFYGLILQELLPLIQTPPDADPADSLQQEITNTMAVYIRSHNGINCSLKELSARIGYSPSHLSHVFRSCMKMSVGSYINTVRAEFARNAFANGRKQKEIAIDLGFSSPAAFWLWLQHHPLDK